MTLRAVAFDMDGLMFNSEDVYTEVGKELMRRRGFEFTKGLKDAMMGLPPKASFKAMIAWYSLPESWDVLYEESEEIFLSLMDGALWPMPGLLELLDSLEQNQVPKAIATSSSLRLTDAVLSSKQIRSRVDFVLTCEDITHGKPDPEIYLMAAERFGIPAAEMMVLEDSNAGSRAAAAAGAFIVSVPNSHTSDHDFSMANFVAESLADPRIYESLGMNGCGK